MFVSSTLPQTIKVLNGRLNDMKKTLQHELKVNNGNASTNSIGGMPSATTIVPLNDNDKVIGDVGGQPAAVMDDVNFKYLKHVILKFLTSREVSQSNHEFVFILNRWKSSQLYILVLFGIVGWSSSPDTSHWYIIAFESWRRIITARHIKLQGQLVRHSSHGPFIQKSTPKIAYQIFAFIQLIMNKENKFHDSIRTLTNQCFFHSPFYTRILFSIVVAHSIDNLDE